MPDPIPLPPTMLVATVYAVMSVVTFVVYWVDKRAAARDRRRVPEARLHLMELLGGWPGALVAQILVRHKSRKLSFQIVFWLIVILHAAAWIAVLRIGEG